MPSMMEEEFEYLSFQLRSDFQVLLHSQLRLLTVTEGTKGQELDRLRIWALSFTFVLL